MIKESIFLNHISYIQISIYNLLTFRMLSMPAALCLDIFTHTMGMELKSTSKICHEALLRPYGENTLKFS